MPFDKKTKIDKNSGLLVAELAVMEKFVDAVALYFELPVQHPSDKEEFIAAVHKIQHLIAMRAMRRLYPSYWYSEN
jgi:hypothetical protein